MIHSTAGGKLKEYSYYDIAKVKYLENEQVAFVLCPIKEVKENNRKEVEQHSMDEESKKELDELFGDKKKW